MFGSFYHSFNNKKKKQKSSEDEVANATKFFNLGSAEAFHILYNRYHNDVYRYCLRMLGDAATAKDAFQETFIRVYEHREDFRGENFTAWLFTITRNTCLNFLRSKKEHESFDEIFHTEEESEAEDIGLKDQVKQALDNLPPSFKEALIMREYNGLSYQEIADALNIDLSLAKIRVYRAREILRKLLKPLRKELYES